ncbi:MAG: FHA domain-containing protein [Actinomycetota bacterium]
MPDEQDHPTDFTVDDNPMDSTAIASGDSPLTTTMRLSAVGDIDTEADPAALSGGLVDPAIIASLRQGTALLVVVHGPSSGSRFLLDADLTTVGRHPHSDIFLDDVTVSRQHAEFARLAGTFLVRDVGSLNGTYVNRERVDERQLQTGDEVQIGKFRLTVHQGNAG